MSTEKFIARKVNLDGSIGTSEATIENHVVTYVNSETPSPYIGFRVEIVEELPATGENGVIYLIEKEGETPDIYDEYIWIESNEAFEFIGTTQIDLSNYYTKDETNALLANKADKSEVNEVATDITNIKNGTTHLFENITDKHGNPRFVEGDITMKTIEGVTQTYGKWSLSGTHLMIMAVLDIESNTSFTNTQTLFNISLPLYIVTKIQALFARIQVDLKTFLAYDDAWGAQNFQCSLAKYGNILQILKITNTTITSNKKVRIQFDLLIDDE